MYHGYQTNPHTRVAGQAAKRREASDDATAVTSRFIDLCEPTRQASAAVLGITVSTMKPMTNMTAMGSTPRLGLSVI